MRVFRWIVAASVVIGLALVLVAQWAEPKQAPRSVLFHGGSIVSKSAAGEVEAMWIRDGRIERIGPFADVRAAAGGDVELVDLGGATLMPGFIEPHTHPLASAMLGTAIDVSGFTHASREELMTTLREATDGFTPQPWIIAFGWDPIMLRDLTPPTLQELDDLSSEKPLVILTQAMHEAFANSAALTAAGISRETPDPPGSSFGRDDAGELTGQVLEVNAIDYLLRALPTPPRALTELILRWQLAEYARQGLTTIGVLGMVGRAEDPLGLLQELSADRSVPVRSVVYALPKDVESGSEPTQPNDGRFAIRGVKLWVDGSPYTGGAAFAQPYEDTELTREVMHLEAGHMGPLNYELDELTKLFARFHEAGYRLAFHTQGERAIGLVLDAAESVLQAHPWKDHRHRLEHNALITVEQIRRAKSLGFELSFFTDHIYYYGDRLPEIVGARTERYMPVGTAFREGHRATIHSDNPMTPVRPLRVMQNAVLRTPRKGGEPVGATERLTVRQAIEAMTTNAAWQLGIESHRGSLEPGKAADLVVLSRNPLETPAEELDDIEVLGTWIDGQPVDTRRASLPNLKIAARALWEWVW
jgi:hypothetical protein